MAFSANAEGGLPFSDLEPAATAWQSSAQGAGPEWNDYRSRVFDLPDGFDLGLDPLSPEYREQQLRLWSQASGAETPVEHVSSSPGEDMAEADFVRRPGYFARRDKDAPRYAAEQTLAAGHILAQSGLKPGDKVLQYGAGSGQVALLMARMGVRVDIVDPRDDLRAAATTQAEFFNVPMTSYKGAVGYVPWPQERYDLVLFHESLGRCLDFAAVVAGLNGSLAPEGRVILCGEPVFEDNAKQTPYPWGLRMDAESLVETRETGALMLGFRKRFLIDLFEDEGFSGEELPLGGYQAARLFLFRSHSPSERPDKSKTAFVRTAFETMLGRRPEMFALAHYSNFVSHSDILKSIASSDEYKARLR